MSKIVAVFDTVDKTFIVSQDSKELKNIESFSVYHSTYEDKNYCSITMVEEDIDNDYKMYHQMVCSKDENSHLAKSKILPDFSVKVSERWVDEKLSDNVTNYLKSYLD